MVFPVAGLGTRFLPATKVVAKEMLPVLDRPLIQYAVDEAVDAGADTLIFVTNRYKHAIADYFDKAYELESKLAKRGKKELLALVQGMLPRNVRCVFVTQPEALGLGHAVLCAKPVVGDEPFGVILPDDLIWNGSGTGALRQMADFRASRKRRRHRRRRSAARAHRQIRHRRRDAGIRSRGDAQACRRETEAGGRAVESRDRRPLCVAGKYFRIARKDQAGRGRRNPAHRRDRNVAAASRSVLAYRFDGTRFDCGNKLGSGEGDAAFRVAGSALAAATREFVKNAH